MRTCSNRYDFKLVLDASEGKRVVYVSKIRWQLRSLISVSYGLGMCSASQSSLIKDTVLGEAKANSASKASSTLRTSLCLLHILYRRGSSQFGHQFHQSALFVFAWITSFIHIAPDHLHWSCALGTLAESQSSQTARARQKASSCFVHSGCGCMNVKYGEQALVRGLCSW